MQTDTKQTVYHERCCVFSFKAVNYVNYRILHSDRAITQRSFHEQISEIIVFVRMYILIILKCFEQKFIFECNRSPTILSNAIILLCFFDIHLLFILEEILR